jgi:hypothetical protein
MYFNIVVLNLIVLAKMPQNQLRNKMTVYHNTLLCRYNIPQKYAKISEHRQQHNIPVLYKIGILFIYDLVSPNGIIPIPQTPPRGYISFLIATLTKRKIHIYFVLQIPKPFDLLGFSRQKNDCFNMR